ncbi:MULTISPECIES: hypothetical protein [unclassified Helicobacter]|nr:MULTISPECIES: hypothetical protein [unclassified Helicobacter]
MRLILQHSQSVDYVVTSGQTMRIRDFVLMACEKLGLKLEF